MEDNIEITLERIEFFNAAQIGLIRQYTNLNRGRKDAYNLDVDSGWNIHIEGACGEASVAKFFNIYWNGNMGDLKAEDVNSKIVPIQVRTRSKDYYELILHDKDPDGHAYILVTGIAPNFHMRGWVYGVDGKKKEYWKDPAKGRPAYFVPHDKMRPIEDLKKMLKIV